MPLGHCIVWSYRLGRSSNSSSSINSSGHQAILFRTPTLGRQCWPVRSFYGRLIYPFEHAHYHPQRTESAIVNRQCLIRRYHAQAVALADEHEHKHERRDSIFSGRKIEEHEHTSDEPEAQDGFSTEALPDVLTTPDPDWVTPPHAQPSKLYAAPGDVRASRLLGRALKFAAEQDIGPPISAWSGNDPYSRFLNGPRLRTDRQMLKVKKILGSALSSSRETSHLELASVIWECIQRVVKRFKDPRLFAGEPPLSLDPETIHFRTKELQVLTRNGYHAPLVRIWIATLLSRDSTTAARLFDEAVRLAESQSCSTPLFIVLGILRRRNMTTTAFRSCMVNCVKSLDGGELDISKAESLAFLGEHGYSRAVGEYEICLLRRWLSLYEVFQSLVNHALRVHPEALEYLSTLWTASMSRFQVKDSETVPNNAILTLFHNRFLFCLSGPAAVEPMKTSSNQLAAQGRVLQHMVSLNPPLNLNREGYRGVLRIQLARPKTPAERIWASLKSESWPPWKEDRTGMDALIGPEHGVSQAGRIMHRLQEAGFAVTTWENTAMILAGWDTDGTPTIQTRAHLRGMSSLLEDPVIWAARIRSTGTRKEAWACFLAHEDTGYPPNEEVYLAMFEKIMAQEVRRAGEERVESRSFDPDDLQEELDHSRVGRPAKVRGHPLLRGDGKEVFPGPRSAHQEIYTRSDVPDALQLLSRMESQGIKPRGRLLIYLMTNTPIWEIGWRVFEAAVGHDVEDWLQPFRVFEKTALDLNTQELLGALIQLMVRFPANVRNEAKLAGLQMRHLSLDNWDLDSKQPLALATNLLILHKPYNVRAWDSYFSALATINPGFSMLHRQRSGLMQCSNIERLNGVINPLVAHRLAHHATKAMQERDIHVDRSIFRHLCTIAYRAAEVASEVLYSNSLDDVAQANDTPDVIKQITHEAERLRQDSDWIRQDFERLTGISTASQETMLDNDQTQSKDAIMSEHVEADNMTENSSSVPRLNVVPSPSLLHSYVRALGAVHDYDGMSKLFLFLKAYWPEIRMRKAEDRNGDELFRRVIVAAKMYLQFGRDVSRWIDMGEDELRAELKQCSITDADHWAAPIEFVSSVHDVVKSMRDEWGAWPRVYEMLVYIERGKTKRQSRSLHQ